MSHNKLACSPVGRVESFRSKIALPEIRRASFCIGKEMRPLRIVIPTLRYRQFSDSFLKRFSGATRR
jgi:hypothetical protein